MDMNINQIIKTIQGELLEIGRPIILLRFSGCNLSCSWCDAYEASHQEITIISNTDKVLERIEKEKGNINSLLLTGGEPFNNIKNENNKEFFNKLSYMFKNIIIETNGFIPDNPQVYEPDYIKEMFPGSIVRIDCSPKINLDAYRKYEDIKDIEDIYKVYSKTIPIIMKNKNYIIKMVYKPEYEKEILNFKQRFHIPDSNFCVLPFTPVNTNIDNFLEQFRKSCLETVNFCINHNVIYSPREHIFLYTDNKNEHVNII